LKKKLPSKDYVIKDLYSLSGKPGMSTLSRDLKTFFSENPLAVDLLDNAATFFFLIDFAKMEYIYVSDGIVNIMGYTAEEWKREGINAAFRTLHPEDKLRLKKLHEDLFAFHFSLPVRERKKYRYISDFRVVRKDGKTIWILSQSSMIALDEAGNTAIGFETCSEITHIKKDNTMALSITKGNRPRGRHIEKKYYYPLEGTNFFTNREIQVLQQVYKGATTKQIAESLSISELTVSKHRLNMMKKAKVTNGASLINYALRNNLL
jgi:DNA-binding CsgD family transcriptional regulator